jgi:hypothetical protein
VVRISWGKFRASVLLCDHLLLLPHSVSPTHIPHYSAPTILQSLTFLKNASQFTASKLLPLLFLLLRDALHPNIHTTSSLNSFRDF